MPFGEIALVLNGSVEVEAHKTGKAFLPDIFTKNLNNLFGGDARKMTNTI